MGLQPLHLLITFLLLCRQNRWGIAKSEVIHVTDEVPSFPEYATPPKFEVSPDIILAEAGGPAKFRCSGKNVTGEKDPDITW